MQAARFAIRAREAIAAARELAAARRTPQVGPTPLLLALLEQPETETLVLPVLNKLGIDVDAVRRNANEAIELKPKLTGDAAEPEFDQEFLATLRRADAEAKKLKDQYVDGADLLIALAEDRNTDVGATREQVIEAIKELRANPISSQNAEDTFHALERFGR